MAEKPTLESLLAPAVEALQSIQKSLATLADVQVAAEFEPDHEKRLEIYKRMDKAAFDDAQAVRTKKDIVRRHEGLKASQDAEDSKAGAPGLKEALDARRQTWDAVDQLNKMFPAMGRLHACKGSSSSQAGLEEKAE